MGILDTLEKIQNKPEHVRRQIMYVALGICMALVFAIWAANFSNTLNAGNRMVADADTTTSPVDYIKNAWNDITGKVNGSNTIQ